VPSAGAARRAAPVDEPAGEGDIVKPAPFRYDRPESLEEGLDLLAEHGDESSVLAGGQSLVPLLALRMAQPSRLVDVNRLRELDSVEALDGGLALGAMVRQRAAISSDLVRERCPLLAEALPLVGHPETRNRGTLGGSVAHADPAAEIPAVVAALDGQIVLRSRRGTRSVPAEQFFLSWFVTAREPDELLTEIRLPAWPDGTGSSFEEVARRYHDFALIGVAAAVQLDGDGRVALARLAYTGAGPVPMRAREAEALLSGREPSEQAIAEVAEHAAGELDPPADVLASAAYRRQLAKTLTRRALATAVARSRGGHD
jgi:carbon-monoxide dehydrogenase medium subunit